MPIEINDLETMRFGVKCAKRSDPDAPLAAVNAAAEVQGVRMISTRVDVSDLPQVHRLEADGYRLMDTLVYYRRTLGTPFPGQADSHDQALRPARQEDAAAVGDVARAAFRGFSGHYHADPRLDDRQADAAYVEWAETSIARTTGETLSIVAVRDQTIVGFLCLQRNTPTQYEVVLNGVSPAHQRGGIYTSLFSQAGRIATNHGGSEIIVSTQIDNYPVQKVWARAGMMHYRSYYTFHKWFD